MTALTGIPVISMEDFIEAYGKEPFEFEYGERFPIMAPQITRSGRRNFNFARRLANFVDENNLGEVFDGVPFVLVLDKTNWVKGSRTPDLMFYIAERMLETIKDPDWEDKPMIGAPDFVVEVVSPTDKSADVNRKIKGYLRDGVRLIWLIEPLAKTVTVYTQGSTQHIVYSDENEILDAGDVIPGFSITLGDLVKSHKY